jgi:hypothetical protein
VPQDSAVGKKPKPRAKKPKPKNDPRLVAAARELRDRYLDRVNADPSALLIEAKYDVSRRIERAAREARPALLLGEPVRSVA